MNMMALWPKWHLRSCSCSTLRRLLNSNSLFSTGDSFKRQLFTGVPSSHRNLHSRSRGLRLSDAPAPSFKETDSDSDSDFKKSRNEKKREARRAVRWGMELAAFSESQITRILRVVSLEEEVFDALVLAKRLGRDVREGKRRQFSYIGRFLREVNPELMDGLIQATKDGDREKFQELSGPETWDVKDHDEGPKESDYEDEEAGPHDYLDIVTRWFDGLISKDVDITNEIYSLGSVEFDRQELRRLVRNFCSMQGSQFTSEENGGEEDAALLSAKRSLTRFLLAVARQLPSE